MNSNFTYRDTTLPESFINKYVPQMYILERGFTDSSTLRGGVAGNIRYTFAPGKGKDLRDLDDKAAEWGLVLYDKGTTFRVLDVYKVGNLTQVLLTTERHEDEDLVIADARKDFEENIETSPVDVLTSEAWKARVAPPVGLDDDGNPFPLV